MTRKSNYAKLCDAYDDGVEACNEYRKECRDFVQELRTAIVESLGCPEGKVFMFQPSKGFVFKSRVIRGDAFDTEFADNGRAVIGFAINVNNLDLQDKFFTFIVIFKKVSDKIQFHIADDEDKKFYNTTEGINDFCHHLYKVAFKNLSERLKIFLQSPYEESAPIGFQVSGNIETKASPKKD